jgi:pimeloyl-ACP methyl ester carboxylesterase
LDYLRDAGHFAMLDTPDTVADRISAFLHSLEHRP